MQKTYEIKMDHTDMGLGQSMNSCGSEKGQEACCCEQGNEPLDPTILGEFLDYIRIY